MGTFSSCHECKFYSCYLYHGTDSLPSETHTVTSCEPLNGNRSFRWTLRRADTLMEQPEIPVTEAPSVWGSMKAIVFASWLNVLLVFIPISWAINFALPDQHTLIFIFTFLAIMPLAKLLAFATDELSLRVGQTLAGLLNATLGNAVELIVSIIALSKCQLSIVQSSLVGSVLSNLLLVLGMCFFAGGLRFSEQGFGQTAAQLNSSLLTISVIAVLIPGAFHMALQGQAQYDEVTVDDKILKTSHGVALILLFIYASYLVFQLFSHKTLCDDDNEEMQPTKGYEGENPFRLYGRSGRKNMADGEMVSSPSLAHEEEGATTASVSRAEGGMLDVEHGGPEIEALEQPQMSVAVCIWLLIVVTVLVAVTAEFLVDSIDGLTATGSISKEFVGVILLPIVGNAAEHVTAVTSSVKDKLTLSLSVAVGSSIQIALFVIPFIVTLGWIMNKPLTLLFDPLESIVMFLSVITVNYVVQDGKSNWLEGMILMCLYLIVAVTFWYYPGTSIVNTMSPSPRR
ncbi:calcium/proton exchanger [Rhizopogon vinicolor AM-OR11-026]|uniref:Calcium/proton exchanger n=1 Tax=Rhizopogon vinicolor AM-OR11-026 TaxID=1314800 RepID=A0A1B7MKI6_9AGAM|nr:calcium/proton exchanger [Rhizopogon vinicolor AM-OR11-026]